MQLKEQNDLDNLFTEVKGEIEEARACISDIRGILRRQGADEAIKRNRFNFR